MPTFNQLDKFTITVALCSVYTVFVDIFSKKSPDSYSNISFIEQIYM